jgi:hypothetical protein
MILSGKDPKSVAAMIVMKKADSDADSLKASNQKSISDAADMDGLSAAFSEYSQAMKDGSEIKAMSALKSFVEMCVAKYSPESEESDD